MHLGYLKIMFFIIRSSSFYALSVVHTGSPFALQGKQHANVFFKNTRKCGRGTIQNAAIVNTLNGHCEFRRNLIAEDTKFIFNYMFHKYLIAFHLGYAGISHFNHRALFHFLASKELARKFMFVCMRLFYLITIDHKCRLRSSTGFSIVVCRAERFKC